jgi:hypothetical protein
MQQKMAQRLAGSKFRIINEQLYTCYSEEAVEMFTKEPSTFDIYHEGFRQQVSQWPTNPVDHFIEYLQKKPASTVVADLGCGEGKIAQKLHDKMTIYSFDLASPNQYVEACDIAHLPISCFIADVVIFSLSLMVTPTRPISTRSFTALRDPADAAR